MQTEPGCRAAVLPLVRWHSAGAGGCRHRCGHRHRYPWGRSARLDCLRLRDRPVYAAQFHIEMDGAPDSSRAIMANFLALARDAAR